MSIRLVANEMNLTKQIGGIRLDAERILYHHNNCRRHSLIVSTI